MKTTINDQEYDIKPMKYMQMLELDGLSKPEVAKAMLKICAGLDDETINNLSFKQGLELQKQVNKANDFQDFPTPTEDN